MLCSAPPRERVELLSSWRDYASWARAMVSLAHRIAIDDPLSDDGAIADYATVWLGRAVSPALAREHIDPRVTPERAGQAVAMRLGDWLALGRVELRVRWSGGFDVALGHDGVPGLFGAPGEPTPAAVSGRSLALCHHCGGLYQPSRRQRLVAGPTAPPAVRRVRRSATPNARCAFAARRNTLRRRPATARDTRMVTDVRRPSGGARAAQGLQWSGLGLGDERPCRRRPLDGSSPRSFVSARSATIRMSSLGEGSSTTSPGSPRVRWYRWRVRACSAHGRPHAKGRRPRS